jgi:hypothetical protein
VLNHYSAKNERERHGNFDHEQNKVDSHLPGVLTPGGVGKNQRRLRPVFRPARRSLEKIDISSQIENPLSFNV